MLRNRYIANTWRSVRDAFNCSHPQQIRERERERDTHYKTTRSWLSLLPPGILASDLCQTCGERWSITSHRLYAIPYTTSRFFDKHLYDTKTHGTARIFFDRKHTLHRRLRMHYYISRPFSRPTSFSGTSPGASAVAPLLSPPVVPAESCFCSTPSC